MQQQLEELRQILTHANTLMLQLLKQQDNPIVDRQEQPKDYEILAFRATDKSDVPGNIFTRDINGCFGRNGNFMFNVDEMLNDKQESVATGHWEIYRVKRLSDGAVWTLGDEVLNNIGGTGNIDKFTIYNKQLRVHSDCFFLVRDIGDLRTADKQPIFMTADNKPIFKHTRFFLLFVKDGLKGNPLSGKICERSIDNNGNSEDWYKNRADRIYSTREAAEAGYKKWLYSQPVLSIDDIAGQPLAVIVDIVKKKIAER